MNTVILTPALLESFTARLRCEEKSPFTVEKYVRDIRAFMAFAGERPLSKELVMEYKAKLLAGGYAKGSVNSILAAVST